MKTTLKVALLASVLMATPVFAGTVNPDDTHAKNAAGRAIDNADNAKLDANGNPVHHKHWHHKDQNYINHDANPNYGAENMHHGWRDADGNWHQGERGYVAGNRMDGSRNYSYNERTADGRWMGMDFNSRHMTDGSDTDANNRGRHAFIFDNGQNSQDFRVGSGHVVKF